MALQFIFGNSGSGKSRYLYEQIIRESQVHPEKNYIVLVPEQFTMQTQRELVHLHPSKGILNIDVLSFGRLAHRVFEEVIAADLGVLKARGRSAAAAVLLEAKSGIERIEIFEGEVRAGESVVLSAVYGESAVEPKRPAKRNSAGQAAAAQP